MKRETREQARLLRQQGHSIKEIAEALQVSRSSVSLWVRDVELTQDQIQALKERQQLWGAQNAGASRNRTNATEQRQHFQQQGRDQAATASALHTMGCMLYWAEGAKSRNGLNFVNADPNMLELFIRFLREELAVNDDEMVLYIHSHSQDALEIDRITHYWLTLLHLPPTALRKVLFKAGSQARRNNLPNGVCSLRVYRTDLVQHIFGAIQAYGGFENPAWLG
jgi:predicted transcriptional regulator